MVGQSSEHHVNKPFGKVVNDSGDSATTMVEVTDSQVDYDDVPEHHQALDTTTAATTYYDTQTIDEFCETLDWPTASTRTDVPTGAALSDFQQPTQIVPFDSLPLIPATSPNKRYTCPICAMQFYDKNNFRHHYMVHSGEKPYPCNYCSYRARQIGSLNKHIKLKHSGRT